MKDLSFNVGSKHFNHYKNALKYAKSLANSTGQAVEIEKFWETGTNWGGHKYASKVVQPTKSAIKSNPPPSLNKWLPVSAVKFNRNGSVSMRVRRKRATTPREKAQVRAQEAYSRKLFLHGRSNPRKSRTLGELSKMLKSGKYKLSRIGSVIRSR